MAFDLQSVLASPPVAYAMIRPDSPIREVWSRYFPDDHAPLAVAKVFRERGFKGSTIFTVLVSVDHLDIAGVDRIVAAFTAGGGWSPEEQDRLKDTFRRLGVFEMNANGVVVAPTLQIARALAQTPLNLEVH